MATYFITPPEATPWRLDESAFERALRGRWPDAEIQRDPDPAINYPLSWTLQGAGGAVEGSLDRAGQAVSLDADLEPAADFALWLRGLVPEEQPLLFCDESFSADVPLTRETGAGDIARAFS